MFLKTSLSLLILLAGASLAGAEVTLLDQIPGKDGVAFRLAYTPRTEAAATLDPRVVVPAGVDQDIALLAEASLTAAPIISRRESILLAVPGMGAFDAADWAAETDPDVAVEISAVELGGVRGIRVDLSPAGSGAGPYTVDIHGRVAGAPATRGDAPAATQTVASAFLNGASSARRSVAERVAPRVLPVPPEAFKSIFPETAMGSVLTLASADASASPRILHHGVVLPVIGLAGGQWGFYIPRRNDSRAEFEAAFIGKNAASPSPAVATRPAFDALSPVAGEVGVTRSRLYSENRMYDRATPLPVGQRFVYYRAVSGETKDTPLYIEDLMTTDTVTLDIRVASVNTGGTSPEHYARFSIVEYVDDTDVAWGGRTVIDHTVTFPAPTSVERRRPRLAPVAAGRTLTFRHLVVTEFGGNPNSLQNLESVRVTWQGKPRVKADGTCLLDVPAAADNQPRVLTIGGFPAGTVANDVLLLDVTNEAAPVRLTDAATLTDDSGTVAVQFEAPAATCSFFAQRLADLPAANPVVASKSLPALPAGTLRGIYVRPAELAAALAPLVAHRGAGFVELDPEAAYDLYSNGQESPEAIRLALSDLLAAAAGLDGLPSVVLVGHATFDPHNYLAVKSGAQVPTFVEESVDTSFTIESCIDFPYGLLVGTDNLQDAMVGRLPAKTGDQLTVMVNRIITHDGLVAQLSSEPRPAVFVTDKEVAPPSPAENPWPPYWTPTGRSYQQIIGSSDANADRAAIKAALEQGPAGPALLYYFGHGNFNFWASDRLLTSGDLATINTASKWPLVITFTCFNGYYAFPGQADPSLGEAWLLEGNNRGTVANIAPSSVDTEENNVVYSHVAMALLSLPQGQRPSTVGELITEARNNFDLAHPDLQKTNRLFLLFGDPLTNLTLDGPVRGDAFIVN